MDIRSRADILRRLAAVHFWIQDRILGQYDEAIAHGMSVIDEVESELARK